MRLIAARLREFTNNRRYAKRYRIRLPFSIALFETKVGSAHGPLTLDGYTYDVSSTGVGLIAPAIRIGGRYLTKPDRAPTLTLRLPGGAIQMLVDPVRYEQSDEEKDKTSYLVGVHIVEISKSNRATLDAYLRTLR